LKINFFCCHSAKKIAPKKHWFQPITGVLKNQRTYPKFGSSSMKTISSLKIFKNQKPKDFVFNFEISKKKKPEPEVF
jgi:hypothetical protein